MGSTYLGRPCKPWLRTHRDTSRVNESPREARAFREQIERLGSIPYAIKFVLVFFQNQGL